MSSTLGLTGLIRRVPIHLPFSQVQFSVPKWWELVDSINWSHMYRLSPAMKNHIILWIIARILQQSFVHCYAKKLSPDVLLYSGIQTSMKRDAWWFNINKGFGRAKPSPKSSKNWFWMICTGSNFNEETCFKVRYRMALRFQKTIQTSSSLSHLLKPLIKEL